MSRSRTRARNRRALLEEAGAVFEAARELPEAFAELLHRLAESNLRVWGVAEAAARQKPLDDDERAMIAQAVAPRLASYASGSVRRRHKLGE